MANFWIKIKDFYEKYKKIIISIAFGVTAILLVLSVTGECLYKRKLDRANRTVEELKAELGETTTRLHAAEYIITDCRENVAELSGRLADNAGKLGDIIQNLEIIRDKVEVLERLLNNSGSNNLNNDYINHN